MNRIIVTLIILLTFLMISHHAYAVDVPNDYKSSYRYASSTDDEMGGFEFLIICLIIVISWKMFLHGKLIVFWAILLCFWGLCEYLGLTKVFDWDEICILVLVIVYLVLIIIVKIFGGGKS